MFANNTSVYTVISNLFRTQRYINTDELGIKCYAAIDSYIQIQDEKIDKTLDEKNKCYFWSQEWQAKQFPTNEMSFEYPLLAVREAGYGITDAFNSNSKANHTFDLLLVDKYYEKEPERSNRLKRRNKFEIYQDCFTLMQQFLETLKTVRAYTYNGDTIYLPESYINALPDSSAFVYDSVLSMKFKAKLTLTDDYQLNTFWGTGNALYGVNISEFTLFMNPCSISVIPPADTIVNFV